MKLSLFPVLLAGLVLSAAIGCSNPQSSSIHFQDQNGIIGGSEAKDTDSVTPSTVSLLVSSFGSPFSFCTGTLISKNLVLTATHCLQGQDASDIFVFFGEVLPTTMKDPGILKVAAIKVHPNYRFGKSTVSNTATGFNDVGLVVLASNAPARATPVPVLNDTVLQNGQTLLLAGYGLVEETPRQIQATGLNYVRVTLAKTFENILVTDQNNASGACSGDSGGPAYLETSAGLIVLGITRGPHDSAPDCRHFGEYTYASRFKDYILQSAMEMKAELPVFVDAPAM